MKAFHIQVGKLCAASLLLCPMLSPVMFTSCKENIDDSAYKISEKKQIMELLEADTATYSGIIKIFNEVKFGLSDNASQVTSVLSARGNYTVFAPTNEAIRTFLKERGKNSIDQLTALEKRMVAYNCIIDNGSSAAYELADFSSTGGTFNNSTLDDRRLTSEQKSDGNYYINSVAKVVKTNVEASNGMLHTVSKVIFPSTESIPEIIQAAPNMRIMGKLLEVTGWADSLATQTEAEDQYIRDNAARIGTKEHSTAIGADFPYMDKRRVRYTAFVETDDVLHNEWGIPTPVMGGTDNAEITNWNEILNAIQQKCASALNNSSNPTDYKNPDNALNQFMAYHFLKGGMPLSGMLNHFNEYNYDYGKDFKTPQTSNLPVNLWDYYTTMGKYRALVKITQVANTTGADMATDGGKYFINRISTYDNSFMGDYHEISHRSNEVANGLNVNIIEKNQVTLENGVDSVFTNNAMNGYYYPIDHILINTDATQTALGSERIRMDVVTMLPEALSNDLREGNQYKYFPRGYFENISNEGDGTQLFYLTSRQDGGNKWQDVQGDEFIATGTYNFVLKLPPVPKSGIYELRIGTSNNRYRSMVQIYMDDKPLPSTPMSLPIDQREDAGKDWPAGIWVQDEKLNYDETLCREVDRSLRNMGYLKGPKFYCVNQTQGKTTIRDHMAGGGYGQCLRYIIAAQYFDKNKTYYIRFKNAIDGSNTQFFLDYLEFCPSSVYNSVEGEDVW